MSTSTTNTFGYNSKSELIDAVMGLDDYGYNYDQIGNRITATSSVDSVTSEMDYLCNALNQYTNIISGTTEQPTYDADGNMLTHGDWTYTWNGENRLITASNATTIVNFKYDYMGRRFEKSVEDGETTTFIYDDWNPILETIQHSTFSITNSFAWGLDLSGSLQGAGGIWGLLSTVQDGDIYFSCFDANGNVTDYVDETGDIVAHYEYSPFGVITSATGDKKDDFNFRFSTKYLDTETALYYYGYRYYSSEMGRWLSRDPILNVWETQPQPAAGVIEPIALAIRDIEKNLYAFVGNDPIADADLNGFCSWHPELNSYQEPEPPPYHSWDDINGCSLSPEDPMKWTPPDFISCPFTPTCNVHDACYGQCFSGKGNCDYAFYQGLLGHCYDCYTANFDWWDPTGWIWLGDCSAVALAYYGAVSAGGGSAYLAGQTEGCRPCCP